MEIEAFLNLQLFLPMKVKYIEVPSQKIAYYESEGEGTPVLFVHGNSASGRAFQKQLERDLGRQYRLVAMDLPGHGDSPMASDPQTYTLPGYARVVVETAEALEMADAVFVGWSLGGHLLLEAADDLEAAGILIFGTPPLADPPAMADAFLENPAVNVGFTANVTEEMARQYAQSFLAPGASTDPTPFVQDILRTYGGARQTLGGSVQPGGYKDEVKVVARMNTPLAVIHGAQEQLINGDYIQQMEMPSLWRGELQLIENAGHAPQWEQPERFNELLAAFINEVTD